MAARGNIDWQTLQKIGNLLAGEFNGAEGSRPLLGILIFESSLNSFIFTGYTDFWKFTAISEFWKFASWSFCCRGSANTPRNCTYGVGLSFFFMDWRFMIAAHRNTLFESDYTEIASLFFPFRLLEDLNCQQNFILMIAGWRDRVIFLEDITAVWLRNISWDFQQQQTNFSGVLTAV